MQPGGSAGTAALPSAPMAPISVAGTPMAAVTAAVPGMAAAPVVGSRIVVLQV